jgi:hypothetical protein
LATRASKPPLLLVGLAAHARQACGQLGPRRHVRWIPLVLRQGAMKLRADGRGEIQVPFVEHPDHGTPRVWLRSMMCTPSVIDRLARSHSATTSTSLVLSASTTHGLMLEDARPEPCITGGES